MFVKRIRPAELPANLVFQLNYLYHTELGKFVAAVDDRKEIMYVNLSVPDKDVKGFLECVTFPCYWLNDYEEGMGEFTDYVFDQYGPDVYAVLIDAHRAHMDRERKRRAKEAAEAVVPLIEKELESETPVVKYDEYLISKIWEHGLNLNRNTPENMTGYGTVCVFYFGYLMGAGMLKGGAV